MQLIAKITDIFIAILVILLMPTAALAWGEICEECDDRYYEIIFVPNSFVIDSLTRIDSLFYPLLMEIKKLPVHGWEELSIKKAPMREWEKLPDLDMEFMNDTNKLYDDSAFAYKKKWIDAKLKDCPNIIIPMSLFSLLKKAEWDSIHSFAEKNVKMKYRSVVFMNALPAHPDIYVPSSSACSIRVNIEPEPSGEHALLLNSTRYRMVKLSNNHYVLRKGK
jgi:hypothetical protein